MDTINSPLPRPRTNLALKTSISVVKNVFLIFLSALAWFSCSFGVQGGTLIARESQWRSWPGDQVPSVQPLGWVEPGFDDEHWVTGNAPFRYGDGAGGTEISGMRNSYSTYFLRRQFSVDSVDLIEGLDLNVDYDDGFAVWLNGVEVLRVNAPDMIALNSFASAGHESGTFETFSLNDAISELIDGQNVIAIQGFNVNLSSSDFLLHPELIFVGLDRQAPTVVSIDPEPGLVGDFEQVRITFSELVIGVEASDLILNGNSADRVIGNGDTYVFTFSNPEPGELTLRWQQDAGITDLAVTPNEFDWQASDEIRIYQLIDQDAPFVQRIFPLPDQTLKQFNAVEIVFSEPVRGVEAADLTANGASALSVSGAGAGPYLFTFEPQVNGVQSLEWNGGHGIEDFAPEPNALQTSVWQYELNSEVQYQGVVISEILAGNQSGLQDDDRDRVDWIELHNTNPFEVDLSGWSLSDDLENPGKWVFGDQILAPNGYLIVFASAKNRPNRRVGASPHINFKLSRAGEFIGLFDPELPRRLVSDLGERYPEQRNDHSFGLRSDGSLGYFSNPTPGMPNGNELISEILPEPSFSASRGYYDQPFQLVLSTTVEGAVVRYTLDKSEPTLENGFTYSEPIALRRTAVIRAAVFKSGYLPSETITHSYLFRMSAARRSLPVLSLVTDNDHLFGPQGIMETNPRNTTKRGRAWERPVSVEYFLPDGSTGFQIDCGLRIQGGNYVRERYNPSSGLPFSKYSYRLYFRGDYGKSALDYPLIPRSPAEEYKQLVLRAGMNDHTDPFIVDELVRRLSADMGQISSQGILVNLYVNGVYKGYYNPTERIDEDFLDTWQGGQGDYDIIAQFGEVRAGDTIEWNRLKQALRRDLSIPSNYEQARQMLNIDNFIDYLILNIYVGTRDWPHNNWRAARERVQGAQWRFYPWDAEWSFFNQGGTVRRNTLANELAVNQDIARFYQALVRNGEFRTRFADRLYQHFFGEGALTDENIMARYQELRNEISGVRNIANSIATSWIPQRRENVFSHLEAEGLFLESNVPQFSEPDGSIRVTSISLEAGEGEIYYTLDGTDPMLPNLISEDRTELISARSIKHAWVPTDSSLGSRWRANDPDIDISNWLRGRGGVGYDEAQTYRNHIGIDVNASMNDKNTSVYVVIPFNVRSTHLEGRNLMNLRVKYDDGFAAYLNGRRIAAANAPSSLQWNSSANGDHPDASAVIFQDFKVSDHLNLLRERSNTLAIHGLNAQLSSSDFLLDALLEVGVEESGRVSEGAVLYTGPIAVESTTHIRARTFLDGRWSAMSSGVFYPGGLTSGLKITEIMYHPPGGDAFEFVELTNFGPVSVDLSRFSFRGISYSFPPESVLSSGSTLVIASDQNPSAFELRYPAVSVGGYFAGSLSNRGESIILEDDLGRYVTGVDYEDQGAWSPMADGHGYSLELQWDEGENSDPSVWWHSTTIGGSPGVFQNNEPTSGLIISEVVAANRSLEKGDGLFPDWVEIENRGTVALDLQGYRLRDESAQPDFVFKVGSPLMPGERLVIWQSTVSSDTSGFSFGLDREGDSVLLLDPDGNRIDSVTFGRQLFDFSLSRSDGDQWYLGVPSPNDLNTPAQTGELTDSLRINEIMANPLPGEDDWVELVNLDTDLPLSLHGLHFSLNSHVVSMSPLSFLEPSGYGLFHADGTARRESVRFRIPSVEGRLELLDFSGESIDELSYRLQVEGESLGRLPNGTGGFRVFADQPTPGKENFVSESETLIINEIMARNQSKVYPGMLGTPDWIELFNSSPETMDLSGIGLRLNESDPWVLPAGTMLGSREYMMIWFDGDDLVRRGEFSGFVVDRSLPASGANIELLDTEGRLLDQVRYGIQLPNQSIGRSGQQWSLLSEDTPGSINARNASLGSVNDLRINEWSGSGDGEDWLEIYLKGTLPVDLSGVYLTDDPSLVGKTKHPIAHLSFIGPNSWVAFNADGETQRGSDHLNFRLSARGETLRIYSENLNLIDEILVAGSPVLGGSSGRLPDGSDELAVFDHLAMTKGRPNLQMVEPLRFNELLLTPRPPLGRAIELFNAGDTALDISGWVLGSDQTSLDAFRLPTGTVVLPGQFTVLHEASWLPSEFRSPGEWQVTSAERIYLSEIDEQGSPTGRGISTATEVTPWDESFGVVELSHGFSSFRLSEPTFGAPFPSTPDEFLMGTGASNSVPHLSSIVISELLVDSNFTNVTIPAMLEDLEYVELFNRLDDPVVLSSSSNVLTSWRLTGGIDYLFESDVIVNPGESLLIVNYEPGTDPSKTRSLQQAWGLPVDTTILGPFEGRLNNRGDRIKLQQLSLVPDLASPANAETIAWMDEDYVEYYSAHPWPVLPQGNVFSLTKTNLDSVSNDPIHWKYIQPTPGRIGQAEGPMEPLGVIWNISMQNDRALLVVKVGLGIPFTVQYSDSLLPSSWINLEQSAGTGEEQTMIDPLPHEVARYYRIVFE